jgi:AraC family transcriptional regulator of adaptative response / DNA-3-methyladenine glycosylase II
VIPDFERCYRAAESRDPRFDGWFVVAVTSTGIYCRPSCPAMTPKRSNTRFYTTAAAAHAAGFRACKRCRPDAAPGSPEWDTRTDVVGRAMRLIADGLVDREGVAGLASRLHFSARHLHRQLVKEVGAGPIALARARRAQTARVLIESTALTFAEVAFAAGFASVRQFNDTIREIFAATPTELRRGSTLASTNGTGAIGLRLPFRKPFDGDALLEFLGRRAVPGIEEYADGRYRRTLRLPHGPGVVELICAGDHVACRLELDDLRDLTAAVQRCRRLLDLDADPVVIKDSLHRDPILRPLVKRHPGLRVPGHVDGPELALRAILGQQVSVSGAQTLTGRLVAAVGKPLTRPNGSLTHVFPEPEAVAEADLSAIGIPAARQRAVGALAEAIATGDIDLDAGANPSPVHARLLELPGIGSWTASYIAMRALRDPDAFLPGDLGVRKAMARLAGTDVPAAISTIAEAWRPWRAYAVQHLWASPSDAHLR